MGVLFEKWRYGFEILVQKPGYSVLAIEKNCNIMKHYRTVTNQMKSESTKQIFPLQNKVKQLKWHLWLVSTERYSSVQYGTQLCLFPL